ncbi:hypothetical protein BGZ76_007311 [Entomortierella beljakovae]|nr:hypothetical protein BGZ76_007311 [Entomortierella beljakovae]
MLGQQDASYNEELLKPILYDIRADEWVYPVVPPAPPKSKLPIIIGCSVAGGVLLIVGIGICCSRCCKTKKSPVSVPKVAEVKSNDTRDIETATVRSEMSDRDHLSFGTGNEPHNGPWSVDNRSTSNSRSIQDQLSMPMRSRHARGNWSVNDRDTTETDSTQDGLSVPSENRRLRGSTGDGSEWSINGLDTIDEAPSRGLALSPLREEYIDDALSIGESMDLDVDNGPINHEDVVLDDLNPPPAYEVDSNTVNAL